MPKPLVILLAVAACILRAPAAPAQQTSADAAGGPLSGTAAARFPRAQAHRVTEGPVVDGDVLGDPAYADTAAASGFRQNRPDEGRRSSERTEVRIVYTDDAIYFGVVCYVRDPRTIIVADSRRDSQLNETDSFQIILDTFRDQQNGFVFGTNPAGVEYDGQVTNEGQGSGRMGGGGGGRAGGSQQQRGSGGGFNLNWDGAWQVASRVTEVGWTAEFAIPFRTLRYPRREAQTWGVNFQRNIRHRNERAFWAPLPRQFNLNRLSLAGELQGIETPAQRNLKLTPYVLGEALRSAAARRTIGDGDFGADLKYSITPSMTLDLTYNTDFAQVEVDEEQINLDRFNLFFPEKRPFFLENAGLFSVGRPGQVEIFFSRRIGIDDAGGQVPILGGARLSGKVGGDTNVGFVNMQTEAVGGALAAQNFTVARVRQDLPSRSNVGVILVNRQATGRLAGDADYNRTFAVDGRFGIGQSGTVSGFASETWTPGMPAADTHAVGFGGDFESENVRLGLRYTEVGPNFNPEVGFYQRRGYRRADASVFTFFRPENFLGLHEIRPHVSHFTFWNFETGLHETQYTHMDSHWEWESGYEVHTGINLTREGLFEPFEIFPGVVVPRGVYDHAEARLTANTNRGAPVSASLGSTIGGFFGGDRVRLTPEVSVRLGETLNAQLRWDRHDINLPSGDFTTNLASLRVSYSFTTRLFLQALLQYNDRADIWSSNVRFGLLSDANTGLFIVYNDIRGLAALDPHLDLEEAALGRTLTVKYSYLFDLLR